ncbi:peptidoglycan DD-metalloendopeptidase family protein [Candidatus Enterococcus leclercqii]|uniref:peptidoglycan DD-metalloendopeptidase family protein n=1 Tax=Candidatus Enterococcus leclercqii TaxID=1857218 RepID=UPI00137AE98F|nr:peptidoglycan DD-metalloendopeptidase family protein [Enterococcus sp. CU9D]KAF1291189.1 phage tail protein [Enterococcus sp. CU9D]
MELETLEVLLDVNTERVQASIERVLPQIESMMSRFEQISGRTMGKTEKNLDIDKGATNFTKQLEKMNQHFEKTMANLEKTSKVSGDNVGSNFASGVRKARPKATKEIDAMVNEINAKMGQAKAAQEKVAYLKSQRQSASSAGDTGKVVKYDEQIARAQAQMSKFKDQAKGMANTIKREFDTVPSSLDTITKSMAQNEGQIESMRKRIKTLKAEYADQRTPVGSFSGGFKGYEDTPQSLKTSAEIQKQSTKMVKLISDNDRLQQEYAQTEDRANSLRKALARINNTMSQSSIQTGSAANGAAQTGSGLKQSERAVSKYGGVFNRMSNAISHGFGGIGNGLKSSLGYVGKFGSLFSSSSNKVTAGNNRMSRSNNTMVQSMRQLLPSLIVYQLLGGAIRALAGGLFSAMKTNDQFAASLNQIKVNLLTAFYPIYTAIMPAINALMAGLAQLTGQFASFIAGIFGTNYEAAKAGASGLYDNVQAMNETGSSADKAKEKVKKLQKSLMGFDQINKLNLDNDDSDKDTSLDNKAPGIDFGSATGTYTTPKWMTDIQKLLKDFFKPFQDAWKSQGRKVIDAWKYALGEVIGLAAAIGKSFMDVWTNGTGQKFIENLLILLADVLNIIGDIAGAFKRAWEDNGRGTKLIQSYFDKWNAILELLHEVAEAFRGAWNDNGLGESILGHILEILTEWNNTITNITEQFTKAWKAGGVGESIFTTILEIVDGLLEKINEMAGATEEWGKKLNFTPLLKSIDKLLKSIKPLTENIGSGLAWFYENVLLPLAKFTIENIIPAFLDLLSGAIDLLNGVIEGLNPAFKWLWDNFLQPIAEWTGGIIVDVLKGLGDVLSDIGDWISEHSETVSNFVLTIGTFVSVLAVLNGLSGVVGIVTGVIKALSMVKSFAGAFALVKFGLGALVTMLGGPLVVGIGLAIAAGVLLWKNWDKIKEVAGKLGKWIGEKWDDIKKATSEAWGKVTDWTSKTWNGAKDKVTTKAGEIWTSVSQKWADVKKNTKEVWDNVGEKISTKAESAKKNASIAFSNLKTEMGKSFETMKTTASSVFGKIGDWASGLGSKIGKGLSGGVEAVKKGAGKIFNGMTSVIGKGVNGVIGGINWVLDKVGAGGSKLAKWEIPTYARGTNYHPGGLALVNDGLGGNYQEAYHTPDGHTGIFPSQRNLMVNLPKGTSVLSGPKTADMFGAPAYAGGIGNWFKEKWDGVKEIASDIWSYASNPGKLLNAAISKFTNLSGAIEPALSMAQGTVGKLADGALGWVKSKFDAGFKKHQEEEAAKAAAGSSFGAGAFAPHFSQPPYSFTSGFGNRGYLFGKTMHYGLDYAAPTGTQIPAQYPGRVSYARSSGTGLGNLVAVEVANGVRTLYGHMHSIAVSAGQNVQRGSLLGLVGNTGNSTGPHVHYELRTGGSGPFGGTAHDPLTYGQTVPQSSGSSLGGGGDIVDRAMAWKGAISNPAYVSFYTNENNAMEGGPLNALGSYLKMGDIAVDPRYHQLGSYLTLNGQRFHAVDVGGAIKGRNRIDVFVGNSQARAQALGRRTWQMGYENGGLVTQDGLYRMGEGNKKEMVIPLEKPQRAAELIQQAIEYLGLDMFGSALTLPEIFQEPSFAPSNSTFSNNDQMNYQGGGMQDFTSAMVTTLMNAISAMGATPTQAPNGDIIINIGGKEFGRIAVKEINKYHEQIGTVELNL